MTSKEAIAKINVLSSYDTSEEKREAYKDCIYAILKDLEILEILKSLIKIKQLYGFELMLRGDDEKEKKIREWLDNEKDN